MTMKTAGRPICGFSAVFSSSEFGKIFILPNLISKSNIPYGDIILRVKLAKIPVLPNRGDASFPARFFQHITRSEKRQQKVAVTRLHNQRKRLPQRAARRSVPACKRLSASAYTSVMLGLLWLSARCTRSISPYFSIKSTA